MTRVSECATLCSTSASCASMLIGETTNPPYIAPRKTLAAATPFGSRYETTSPGRTPIAASSAQSACAVMRSPAYDIVVPGSGASRNGASGWVTECRSTASRTVRIACNALKTVLPAILGKEFVVGRNAHPIGRERMHDARDVEEMPVAQIVRDAVAAPRPAAHRQRER